MKIQLKSNRETGSMLAMAVMFIAVSGILLGSYLVYVNTQNKSVARAQVWNAGVPIMEAGVEEALTHLNKNCLSNDINGGVFQPTVDNWTASGTTLTKTHSGAYGSDSCVLPDGSYYDVRIENYDGIAAWPTIYVTATLAAPLARLNSGLNPMFATVAGSPSTTLSRRVKVTTLNSRVFRFALAAKGTIDLNGNNVKTDSFDSTDPNYSTNGKFDSSKTKANGDVATNTNIVDGLDVGNANIKGSAHSGPGSTNTIQVGSNGSVGDAGWVDGGNTGIQTNHSSSDMNQYFPDVTPPFTSGSSPLTGVSVSVTNVTTNSMTTTNIYPPATPTVAANQTIVTNWAATSSTSLPSGTYQGLTTNTSTAITTTTYPSPGTYVGTVTTNSSFVTSTAYPSSGVIGAITTNYIVSYVLPITTHQTATKTAPYPAGGYTNVTYNSSSEKYTWDNLTATNVPAYSYSQISGYTYTAINSYSYSIISNYVVTAYGSLTTNVSTETYDYVFTAPGDYVVSSLSGKVLVRGGGTARILCEGNVSFTGQGGMTILNGCSVKLYVAGESTDISGKGVINESGKADAFQYYGLPTNTSINMHGNFSFTGVIYAPNANVALGGGGSDTFDFVGAVVAGTATMNGHTNLHYDESLSKNGPQSTYAVGRWAEY